MLPLLGRGVYGLMARIGELLKAWIVLRQLHEESVALPAPAIALNAADEPLAVVVDLDERATAVGTGIVCHLVPKALAGKRPALFALILGTQRRASWSGSCNRRSEALTNTR